MTRPVSLPIVLLAASALGAGCAHLTPPARSSGPLTSREGVALSVTRQSCYEGKEPDWPGDDLAEVIVEVQVHNGAVAPIAVDRRSMRLSMRGGGELETRTMGAAQPMAVPGGDTTRFELRYMSRGYLRCAAELHLDTQGSVTLLGRVLETGRITFVPAEAL